jgi:hypothetical protein
MTGRRPAPPLPAPPKASLAASLHMLGDMAAANPRASGALRGIAHTSADFTDSHGDRAPMHDLIRAFKGAGGTVEIDPQGDRIYAHCTLGAITVSAYDYQTTAGDDGFLYRLAEGLTA